MKKGTLALLALSLLLLVAAVATAVTLRLQPTTSIFGILAVAALAIGGVAAFLSGWKDFYDFLADLFGRDSHASDPPAGQSAGAAVQLPAPIPTAVNYVTAARDAVFAENYIAAAEERPPIWAGVPPLPTHFVGREKLVSDLAQRLTSGESLALAAEGKPGVGKTTLAVALAHHRPLLAHFTDGVLWAGLGPQGDVMSALAAWGQALGQDISHLADPIAREQAVRDAIGRRRLLLVIDDVWEGEAAARLRCGGPHCAHLLTTRDKGLARAFAGAAQVENVPTLADDPAFTLLQKLAPEVCQRDSEAARGLAQAVGGLPLALELLGGYLAAPEHWLFAELSQAALREMADPQRRLQLAQERLGAPGQKITLLDTINLSLAGLRATEAGREAERVFYALGAFAPKPATFSREAAESVAETRPATLAWLVARNLVEKVDEPGEQLALHQTLAEVARTRPIAVAQERHRAYYLDFVNQGREDWRRIEAVYGQVQWAWAQAANDEKLLDLVWALRLYQERRGLWRDYLAWAGRGLQVTVTHHLRQDEGTLLNNLGGVYHALGQRDKALEYYGRALPIREEVGDRAGLATTLNNLGWVYHALGQPDKALAFYNRALPILEEVGDRAGLAATLNNIGAVYDALGQPDKALEFYNRARPILEEVGDRAVLAVTLNNIGRVYDNLGQPDKALAFYNRALPIREEVGDRAGLATTLSNIGAVYNALGQRDKALEFYNRARPIQEEVGDRYGESITRYNLAMVYRQQGRLAEAVTELRRVVELDRLVQHPDLADDMATLAQVEAELSKTR